MRCPLGVGWLAFLPFPTFIECGLCRQLNAASRYEGSIDSAKAISLSSEPGRLAMVKVKRVFEVLGLQFKQAAGLRLVLYSLLSSSRPLLEEKAL